MLILLRLLLAFAWFLCAASTIAAVRASGVGELMPTFFAGFGTAWGAALNIDLSLFLAASGLWLIWSAKTLQRGLLYAALAVVFGGSFTYAYVLVQTFFKHGDLRAVLLGRQACGCVASTRRVS